MRRLTYIEAIEEALREEMERDERVIVMALAGDARSPEGRRQKAEGSSDALSRLPSAYCLLPSGLPVSASGSASAALGAALAGLRPVLAWPSTDAAIRAMGVLVSQIAGTCYRSAGAAAAPIVFRIPIGDRALSPEGWLAGVPGLKVLLPSTPRDARGLLKSAIRDDNPVLFLEHQELYEFEGDVPEDDETIPIGKARVRRTGSDVSIITYSAMVEHSLAAAEILAEEQIAVEVLDLRSALPLDEEAILESVARTGRLVVAQAAYGPCSVAAEVAALVAEKALYELDAPIQRVTARWAPLPFAPELARAVLPQTDQIVAAVRAVMDGEETGISSADFAD